MSEYCSVRVWQLKAGASTAELEMLAATGVAEMHRWIAGIEQLSLVRVAPISSMAHTSGTRYLMITTFTNYEAYIAWRRIEEEGPDYWERYASVFMHWEQLAHLVEEYTGDSISLMGLDRQQQPG
ncbi:MAG TPA: hypothetical protein VKR83_11465 [Ktedonobacteraceae bacterium]|nr:hypothetical protein [Ktedonobacteraceae bacterium]